MTAAIVFSTISTNSQAVTAECLMNDMASMRACLSHLQEQNELAATYIQSLCGVMLDLAAENRQLLGEIRGLRRELKMSPPSAAFQRLGPICEGVHLLGR